MIHVYNPHSFVALLKQLWESPEKLNANLCDARAEVRVWIPIQAFLTTV